MPQQRQLSCCTRKSSAKVSRSIPARRLLCPTQHGRQQGARPTHVARAQLPKEAPVSGCAFAQPLATQRHHQPSADISGRANQQPLLTVSDNTVSLRITPRGPSRRRSKRTPLAMADAGTPACNVDQAAPEHWVAMVYDNDASATCDSAPPSEALAHQRWRPMAPGVLNTDGKNVLETFGDNDLSKPLSVELPDGRLLPVGTNSSAPLRPQLSSRQVLPLSPPASRAGGVQQLLSCLHSCPPPALLLPLANTALSAGVADRMFS
jgi:hypothetical protein